MTLLLAVLSGGCARKVDEVEGSERKPGSNESPKPSGDCKMIDRGDGSTYLKCADGTQMLVSGDKGSPCQAGVRATCAFTREETAIAFPALNKGHPLEPCTLGLRTCTAEGIWGICEGAIAPRGPNTCSHPDCNCDGVED